MTRVGTSDWFRLQTHVAPRTRIEYLVVHGQTDYRVDPNNPRRAELHTTDPVSEMVTPDYVPPRALTEPHVTPRGRTVEGTIQSRALDGSRRVIVYLPPGYRDDGAYPVAVFHSGWERVRAGELPRVLDWLIGHRFIEPIIVAFLEYISRRDPTTTRVHPCGSYLTQGGPGVVGRALRHRPPTRRARHPRPFPTGRRTRWTPGDTRFNLSVSGPE